MKTSFIKSIGATVLLPFASERKSTMKLVSAIVLAVAAIAALIILPARATSQAGVSSVTIAQGTFDEIDVLTKTDMDPGPATDYWKAMISTKGPTRVYVVQNTVAPGGSFGWHSHPGPTFVFVVAGTATEYHGDDRPARPSYTRRDRASSIKAKTPDTSSETMATLTLS